MIELRRYNWRETLTLRIFPNDLKLVGGLLAGSYLLVVFGESGLLQTVLVAVLLCFLPGYVTVAALFPWHDRDAPLRRADAGTRLSLRERAAVSLGLSVALLPLLGLTLSALGVGFSAFAILNIVGFYIVAGGALATVRRRRLPESDRFELPIDGWFDELTESLTTGSLLDRTLTAALLCSIVLAGVVFVFAVGSPVDGQTHTDFHLVTDDDGEYVSSGYPDELVVGESAELAWGVHNSEGVETDYTVVITQERVTQSDGELVRLETVVLDRHEVTVADGEREMYDHEMYPTLVGEDLRIGYYLYRGDVSESPDTDEAYRSLHIWIDVEPSA